MFEMLLKSEKINLKVNKNPTNNLVKLIQNHVAHINKISQHTLTHFIILFLKKGSRVTKAHKTKQATIWQNKLT